MAIGFRSKNLALVQVAVAILEEEKPMTLRQLYYRVVSAGALRNTQAEYQRLGGVMTRLREDGKVPRSWIVDHVRTTLKPSSWSGLADFGESVRSCYRKDFWASMAHHVEIFVEKDAIAGAIQPVTEEYDVALQVCRGYASVSFASDIAELWAKIRKPIFAYYLGDFDASGFDIERDLREKLQRYSGKYCILRSGTGRSVTGRGASVSGGESNPTDEFSGGFCWRRLAVQPDDFDVHDLIRLPVKHSDKRAKAFIREHGEDCAEVDALPPSELRRRVEDAINNHIDGARWLKLQEIERVEQESLDGLVQGWRQES
jgi:hypothetical protein